MKPHLPVRLFRAVALVLAAAPAALYADYTAPTEIVVPDSYTNSVELKTAQLISLPRRKILHIALPVMLA